MKKILKEKMFYTASGSNRRWKLLLVKGFLFLWIIFSGLPVFAQNTQTVKGNVVDKNGEPLIGVSVVLKNAPNSGTITDVDGNFTLTVPAGKQTLVVSYIGMIPQEVVTGTSFINVVLRENAQQLGEVVVVGFGSQRKESVVGAITQTTGRVLERAGGVSSVGQALTGNLPGVVTIATTGMPGQEDPQILIRGVSSWNSNGPLILVDNIERPINSVDINSVETISVLKDASATAVFGVRGANGVILITTKRGQEGRADIQVNFSSTMKTPSRLPSKFDSYDALMVRNQTVESELGVAPGGWASILPQDIINKYRNPANLAESERYPNTDWRKALLNDYAMSYNANINISGGTKFVKYFANVDYQREGDLYRIWDNNRGYQAGYGFDRLNVRSNLDFQLTKTTSLKANLSGSHGVKKGPGDDSFEYTAWLSIYGTSPDAMLPRYSDGTWGYYKPDPATQINQNSVETMAIKGIGYTTTDRINTDFTLNQDLDMVLKGLKVRGLLSFDNEYQETQRGINDIYNGALHKWIDPETGFVYYDQTTDALNKFDFQEGINWSSRAGSIDNKSVFRKLYYSVQLNYANTFGKNNVTAMGDFNREENAKGSVIPSYRENWVFRTTYDFDKRYLFEYNGAYNGSEKFAPKNRFVFFQSGALGWTITEEPYFKKLNWDWLEMFKLRGSYGKIGDDMISGDRWLYMTTWAYGSGSGDGGGYFRQGLTGVNGANSPYAWYREASVGNPDIQWETVTKLNIGADFSAFRQLVTGSVDVFRDKRRDIFLRGSDRAVPSYFGAAPPAANLGSVNTQGLEIDIRLNKRINDLHLYADLAYTHAQDKVLVRDDAELLADYRKQAGFPIDQPRYYVNVGYINNWDEVYGSTAHDQMDNQRKPGDYVILDFDADGIISNKDNIPYSYSPNPQNTFNTTIGADYKGWSGFVQFYGVTNVSRWIPYSSLGGQRNTVFDEGTYWSPTNMNPDVPLPRWFSVASPYSAGTRFLYDASYARLKNVEIAYTFTNQRWLRTVGMKSLRLFLNGDNLWLYTRMPDDRERNFTYSNAPAPSQGAYPTVKRFNLGFRITL